MYINLTNIKCPACNNILIYEEPGDYSFHDYSYHCNQCGLYDSHGRYIRSYIQFKQNDIIRYLLVIKASELPISKIFNNKNVICRLYSYNLLYGTDHTNSNIMFSTDKEDPIINYKFNTFFKISNNNLQNLHNFVLKKINYINLI